MVLLVDDRRTADLGSIKMVTASLTGMSGLSVTLFVSIRSRTVSELGIGTPVLLHHKCTVLQPDNIADPTGGVTGEILASFEALSHRWLALPPTGPTIRAPKGLAHDLDPRFWNSRCSGTASPEAEERPGRRGVARGLRRDRRVEHGGATTAGCVHQHPIGVVSSAAELLDLLALVRPDLSRLDQDLAADLRPREASLQPLLDHVTRYRGKQLRPALVFLAARMFDGVTPEHVTCAKVVELIHIATLVHDDILDDAAVRRQEPTLNRLHGNEMSVLLGDYICARAFHLAAQLDDPTCAQLFSKAMWVMCQGEISQCLHRGDDAWDEERYFEVISQKTASLYAAACQVGVHYAGGEAQQAQALWAFGRDIGVAFQIMDDCLDLTGDEDVVGKSLGTDLGLGKLTLPLLKLLKHSGERRGRLLHLVGSCDNPAVSVAELRAEFDVDAAVINALTEARRWVERGLETLQTLPEGPARDAMADLADYVVRRNF